MKNIVSILSAYFLISMLYSQEFKINWQTILGGSEKDAAHAVVTTRDNGFIIAGSTKSIDGDVLNNIQNRDSDFWIIKLDESGKMDWSKTYGGTDMDVPNAIITTTDLGYLVVGFTESDDGDVVGFHGQRDGWILKLDENGNIEWQRTLGGSGSDNLSDVVELDDGYLISGQDGSDDGDLEGLDCNSDFWLIKLNFQGEIIWKKCYGGLGDDYPNKMARSFGSIIYVAGYTNSEDGDVSNHKGDYDFWIVAINNQGDLIWEKTLGGSKRDVAKDINVDGILGIINIIGETDSSDGDVSLNHGETDIWRVVLSPQNQSIMGEFSFGGSADETVDALRFYLFQDLFFAGSSSSDDGDVTENHGGNDMWIVDLGINAFNRDIKWSKCLGGSGFDRATAITLSFDQDHGFNLPNGVVLVGITNSIDGDIEGLHGDYDIWVVNLTESTTPVQDVALNPEQVNIYPNPTINELYVDLDFKNFQKGEIQLFDTSGKLLFSQNIYNEQKSYLISLDDIPHGMYWCLIRLDDKYLIYKQVNIFNQGY